MYYLRQKSRDINASFCIFSVTVNCFRLNNVDFNFITFNLKE